MNAKNQRADSSPHMEDRLRILEAALDTAIERAKTAKAFARQAKDEAKLAKKDKKRARRALIEAQEEYGVKPAGEPDAERENVRPFGERIAESPERRRRVRVKKKATKPRMKKAAEAAQVEIEQVEPDASDVPAK